MKEKYLFFGMIQTDILPIIFHTEHCYDNGKTNYSTMGNLYIAEKQNVINVFCCMRNEEETQRTIRHEVLHYMLYIAGLKYADDTAIFHYLCGEYNANAYKEMGDTEQQLYDQLINGVEMLKDACNRNKELDYDLNYICMLLAVCTDEDNSTYDVLCKRGNEILQLFDLKKKAS
jgi:predicted SprT family Zn-dependent metalloprotease